MATVPLRAGEYVLGARVNTPAVADLVREVFRERVVEGANPPNNLSLRLTVDSMDKRAARQLHQLYLECSLQQRTRDPFRAIGALWHELNGYDVRWEQTSLVLDATVLLQRDRAHILPAFVRRHVVGDQRRWESLGLRVWDARWVPLDLATGEVVLQQPSFTDAASDIEAGLRDLGIAADPAPAGATERVPIASWTVPRGMRSPAERVMRATGQILDRPDHLDANDVRRLALLLSETDDLGLEGTGEPALRVALQNAT